MKKGEVRYKKVVELNHDCVIWGYEGALILFGVTVALVFLSVLTGIEFGGDLTADVRKMVALCGGAAILSLIVSRVRARVYWVRV